MANEIRVRANFVAGQLSSAMLTGDTTIQGAGLADLPAIGASEFAPVAIFRTDNAGRVTQKEIVHVTAHTAGATSATCTRGREGTTAQTWNAGDRFSHTDTALDNLIVCTEATKPSTPFEGLECYCRDSGVRYLYDGSSWLEIWAPAFPMKAYRTANYAHAVGWNKVPVNATFWDPTAKFVAATSRYVTTMTGIYEVYASAECILNNNPQRFIPAIRRNGVEDQHTVWGAGHFARNMTGGDALPVAAAGEIRCTTVGDYLEFWLYNNGGNATNVSGNANGYGAQLTVRRKGPLP